MNIERYKKYINTEFSNEKKEEIIDLLSENYVK